MSIAPPDAAAGLPALDFETRRAPLEAAAGPSLRIALGDATWLEASLRRGGGDLREADTVSFDADDPVSRLASDLPAALDRCAAADPQWKDRPAPSSDPVVRSALRRALDELRNPPIDLDALTIDGLRRRVSEKWSTYPPDILPAWVAEMDFPLAGPVRAVLARAAGEGDVGYPLGLRETGIQQAFADRAAERFGWPVDPARVEVLSEVVQGMHVAMRAFSEPGDGALVQTPIYPPFLGVVRETGRRLVENRLDAGAGHGIDFDALRAAAGPGTAIAFLCNPHNPTGRAFAREELEALAALAIERDWIVVMDEIHADLVFEGRPHIPFASLGEEVARRTITLTSATKAFNIPGLRCAVAHFGSEALQQRFNAAVSRRERGGLGLLGLHATVAAWRHGEPWLDDVRAVLERNRDRVADFVRERLPRAKLVAPQATYLAWIDFSAYGLEPSPGRWLARHGRVALSDGPNFGTGLEGYARLNFATSGPILDEIFERIAGPIDARAGRAGGAA